jgi:sec-independent protein translocase protein TatA
MPHLGLGELIVIFMLAFLVFGATRLPQIGEGMGKAIRSFRRGLASNDDIEVSPTKKQVSSESNSSQADTRSKKAQS